MKQIPGFRIIIVALVLVIAPLVSMADTTFFSDNFTGSSTLDKSPTTPPLNGASYQTAVGGVGGTSNLGPNDLSLTFPTTNSILGEIFAMFTNSPIALTTVGDHIAISVVFTNTLNVLSGGDSGNATINIGLYYSGGTPPNQGHIVLNAAGLNGGTQGWLGYFGQIFWGTGTSSIRTRPAQGVNGATSQNQDLLFSGASSTQAFNNPTGATIGSTNTGGGTLTIGGTYTLYLSITLSNASTLLITNTLYAGAGTGGTVLYCNPKTAITTNILTTAFDGMAIGWRNTPASQASTMDISSIQITGQSSPIPPPTITSQPAPAVIATNGSGAFFVTAGGVALNYQWKRNGASLVNGGHISGATSPTLIISSAGTADELSGANGYYCTVYNLAGTTNSVTNSLSLIPGSNLVWTAAGGNVWDVGATASWNDTNGNQTVFNYGDSVTLDDTASTRVINLTGSYLSAASVTMNSTHAYTLQGSGSFAGPGSLIYTNSGQLTINSVNTYTGGTIISNAGLLYLQNYNGLGSGPVTLVGGPIPGMEIVPAGGASTGISGDINVVDDFTIQFDGTGNFTGVFFGNLSGTAGKTLTLTPQNDGTTNRFRVYGTSTVYNGNLVINGTSSSQANYYGSTLAPYNSSGSQTYNGIISGNAGLIQRASGTTILNGQNTYAGGTTPSDGVIAFGVDTVTNVGGAVVSGPIGTGPLFVVPELPNVTGNGQVMAWGGARTIANPIVYPSATNNQTLIIGGTNTLTFTAPIALNGLDGIGSLSNRIFQVTNTALTTFSGVISDGGGAYSLTKTGTNGVLALNNAETYTGPTLVSNGTLQVNGSLAASSAVTVSSNATLAGTGTINGPVTVNALGTLAPGTASAIGTLTINNNFTNKGNLFFKVNKLVAQSNDIASVSGTLVSSGSGTLTVTNIGPALALGDKFQVFSKAVTGGGTLNVAGAGVTWANNLAGDGSISVTSLTVPQPVIVTTTLSGTNLVFSGTNGTATSGGTYYVLSSTNVAAPLSSWTATFTNTFGTGGAFSVTNPIVPGMPVRFYLLNVP